MEKFSTEIEIALRGHGSIRPIITFGINEEIFNEVEVSEYLIKMNVELEKGLHKIFINFNNKINSTPDMAVEILYVKYEGMQLDRFKWANKYYPIYPEPWASQQKDPLPKYQTSATYLGWNGRIEFEFETPIYTWIHRLENLGWIYP